MVLARKALTSVPPIITLNEARSYIQSVATLKMATFVLERLRGANLLIPHELGYQASPEFLLRIGLTEPPPEQVADLPGLN